MIYDLDKEVLKKKGLLLVHKNADLDSLGAAIAFKELIQKFGGDAQILAPKSISSLGESFLNKVNVHLSSEIYGAYDLIVVFDTSNSNMLDMVDLLDMTSCKILIDHHKLNDEFVSKFDKAIVDPNSSSTCEIIISIFKSLNVKPTDIAAKALVAGILTDSQNLRLARCTTLKALQYLCKFVNLEEVKDMLYIKPDSSETIAKFKAAKRLNLFKLNDYVLIISQVGSFQAMAANSFIYLGADIAFVGGKGDGKLRVSGRSSINFFKKTGIDIGENILKPIAKKFNGNAGGHPTAATMNIVGSWTDVKSMILNVLGEDLKFKIKELK